LGVLGAPYVRIVSSERGACDRQTGMNNGARRSVRPTLGSYRPTALPLTRLNSHKGPKHQRIHIRALVTIHRLRWRIDDRLILVEARIERDVRSRPTSEPFNEIVIERVLGSLHRMQAAGIIFMTNGRQGLPLLRPYLYHMHHKRTFDDLLE